MALRRLRQHWRAELNPAVGAPGHASELPTCPKCQESLTPGVAHTGCAAGPAAPRQAAKRRRARKKRLELQERKASVRKVRTPGQAETLIRKFDNMTLEQVYLCACPAQSVSFWVPPVPDWKSASASAYVITTCLRPYAPSRNSCCMGEFQGLVRDVRHRCKVRSKARQGSHAVRRRSRLLHQAVKAMQVPKCRLDAAHQVTPPALLRLHAKSAPLPAAGINPNLPPPLPPCTLTPIYPTSCSRYTNANALTLARDQIICI